MSKTATTYTRTALPRGEQGTCPFCLRRIKVRASGRTFRHGWTESGRGSGWVTMTSDYCVGTDHRPIEETDADTRAFIVGLGASRDNCRKSIDSLKSGETKTLLYSSKLHGPWLRDDERNNKGSAGIPGVTPKNAEYYECAFSTLQLAQAGALRHNGLNLPRKPVEQVQRDLAFRRRERIVYTMLWEIGPKFTAMAPAEQSIFNLPACTELRARRIAEYEQKIAALDDQIVALGEACEAEAAKLSD